MSARHLLAADNGINQFFKSEKIQTLWDLHQSGTRNYATILWSLFMFELWFQRFMR
jgi:asparagine synthase (glutamine-hydrolysing)